MSARVAALGLALIAACGGGETGERGPRPVEPAPADLEDLGYASYAGVVDDEPDGVVLHDRERSSPGFDLYTSIPHSLAVLLDPRGRPIRRWHLAGSSSATRCELLPDGDVLLIGDDGEGRCLVRMDWEGELVWKRSIDVHHDVELAPDGSILALTMREEHLPEVHPVRASKLDVLARLSGDGEVVDELSLHEPATAEPRRFELRPRPDLYHGNSIEQMPHAHLVGRHPIYDPDCVLYSARHQDTICVFDWSERALVWAWGQGEVIAQHEASWLTNGNLLLLDNGDETRPYSRIVEVDPVAREVVWTYVAPEPETFYSAGRGTAQGLPNGNVLVGNSNRGEAFEVTRDGTRVWRFLNPHRGPDGARGAIRIRRYEPAFVRRILEGR